MTRVTHRTSVRTVEAVGSGVDDRRRTALADIWVSSPADPRRSIRIACDSRRAPARVAGHTSPPREGVTVENYDRGGGRSGASERLWYVCTSVTGALDPSALKPTSACSARDGVPQAAIETQFSRQSVLCCFRDCEGGSAQCESAAECSIGEAVAATGDSCSPSQAHAGITVIACAKAMTAAHAVMSLVLRVRRFASIRRKPGRTGDYVNECRHGLAVCSETPDIRRGIPHWLVLL